MKYKLSKNAAQMRDIRGKIIYEVDRPTFNVFYVNENGHEIIQTKFVQTVMISFNLLDEKLKEIEKKAAFENKLIFYYKYGKWNETAKGNNPPSYFVRYALVDLEMEI